MRIVSAMMLAILMTGFVVLAFNVRQAECKPRMIVVPDDYATIQDAIDNASAGDTIFVRAGTYYEHIEIDKPLTLEGESNQNTTIELRYSENLFGIHIVATGVTIRGFNLVPIGRATMLIMLDGRTRICSDNTIEDNVLADQGSCTDALTIYDASDNRILNNTVEHNRDLDEGSCIFMYGSDNNIVSYNTLIGGWVGVELEFCNYNVVRGNYICNQTTYMYVLGAAIQLMQSSNDVVVGNTLTANELGVSLLGASSNLFYHNNFEGNTHQVYVRIDSTSNLWDNGYPDGGNYWDDYNGADSYSGPYQNVTGGDGIGDTPYIINNPVLDDWESSSINNTDHYPFMSPLSNGRITGDVNMDGVVDGSDMALVAWSFGAYGPNYLYPGSLPSINWNPDCDVNGDGVIDGSDLILIALNFGK
jgi:parallel beta-helix repeat protein